MIELKSDAKSDLKAAGILNCIAFGSIDTEIKKLILDIKASKFILTLMLYGNEKHATHVFTVITNMLQNFIHSLAGRRITMAEAIRHILLHNIFGFFTHFFRAIVKFDETMPICTSCITPRLENQRCCTLAEKAALDHNCYFSCNQTKIICPQRCTHAVYRTAGMMACHLMTNHAPTNQQELLRDEVAYQSPTHYKWLSKVFKKHDK